MLLARLDFDPTTSPGVPFPDGSLTAPDRAHFLWLEEPDDAADFQWPFDDLRPRDIGIHQCFANIGGGVALTGKEPAIDSGNGYWRIVLGAIPIRTRAQILTWRALEAQLEGRGNTIAVPIYDGKRAPWPGVPGGNIDAEAYNAVDAGTTVMSILATDAAELEVGMHFSVGQRLYRIKSVVAESSGVFDCVIWPKTRAAIAAGTALDFRRPVCIVKLADDMGMSLELDLLKRGQASVEFVEAV